MASSNSSWMRAIMPPAKLARPSSSLHSRLRSPAWSSSSDHSSNIVSIQPRSASNAFWPAGRLRSAAASESISRSALWKTTASFDGKYEKKVRGATSAASAMSAIVVAW